MRLIGHLQNCNNEFNYSFKGNCDKKENEVESESYYLLINYKDIHLN